MLTLILENPALPADLLGVVKLPHLAGKLLKNPVFPLLLLEDPTLQRCSHELRCGLAGHPETPLSLLLALASYDDASVRCQLAKNPSYPEEKRRELISGVSEKTRVAIASMPVIPQVFHHFLLSDTSPTARRMSADRLSRCTHCDPFRGVLRRAARLADDPSRERRLNEPEQRLLLAGGPWARILLARQPELDPGCQQALAADPEVAARKALAAFPGLADAIAVTLAADHDDSVQLALCARLTLSHELALALAASSSPRVRHTLARHPLLPAEVAALLSKDPRLASEVLARAHKDGAEARAPRRRPRGGAAPARRGKP